MKVNMCTYKNKLELIVSSLFLVGVKLENSWTWSIFTFRTKKLLKVVTFSLGIDGLQVHIGTSVHFIASFMILLLLCNVGIKLGAHTYYIIFGGNVF